MYKLLSLEDLPRKTHTSQVISPRSYCFWWKNLLNKHREYLLKTIIKPVYYER